MKCSVVLILFAVLASSGCASSNKSNEYGGSQLSDQVVNAIGLCSAGYASADAGQLSARLISSGANIKGELSKIESGTLNLSNVDMYKRYLTCVESFMSNNQLSMGVKNERVKINSNPESIKRKKTLVDKHGMTFSLRGCSLDNGAVSCNLQFISNDINREIWWCGNSSQRFCGGDFQSPAYDNYGNKYIPSTVRVSNSEKNYLSDKKLIANVKTEASIRYENISTRSNGFSLIEISLVILERKNRAKHKFIVQFRDVPFS